ncbi:MAG: hypothetical protein JRM99_00190 [Nitrososphaerota archaeon]|nr:hypothetical protein [Nitrososphaerota archaeon]
MLVSLVFAAFLLGSVLLIRAPAASASTTDVISFPGQAAWIAVDSATGTVLAVVVYPGNNSINGMSINMLGMNPPSYGVAFNTTIVSGPDAYSDYGVGGLSHQFAVDPSTGEAFVGVQHCPTNSNAPCWWDLVAINISTGAVTATIPVDVGYWVTVDTTTHMVFTAGSFINQVAVVSQVSEASDSVTSTLNASSQVANFIADSGNQHVYAEVGYNLLVLGESPLSVVYNSTVNYGADLWDLAVDPSNNLLYFDSPSGPSLTVVSATSYQVVGTSGDASDFIAVNPSTHVVFMATAGDNVVSAQTFGGGTMNVVENLPIPPTTGGVITNDTGSIAVDPTRNLVYVITQSQPSTTIGIVDTSTALPEFPLSVSAVLVASLVFVSLAVAGARRLQRKDSQGPDKLKELGKG